MKNHETHISETIRYCKMAPAGFLEERKIKKLHQILHKITQNDFSSLANRFPVTESPYKIHSNSFSSSFHDFSSFFMLFHDFPTTNSYCRADFKNGTFFPENHQLFCKYTHPICTFGASRL